MTVQREAAPFLDYALPGWATDRIRSGIPEQEARDPRRVWTFAMTVAMSAHRRGWTEAAYRTEIAMHENGLWRQLTTRPGGRRVPKAAGYKALQKAWEAARLNVNNVGVRTKEEIAADAAELAFKWVDRITVGADGLSTAEAAVMGYVIAETEQRGYLRVTCPGREVAEFAKIPHRSAARVLASLAERGLLIRYSPGRRGTGSGRRAAIYGLSDPDSLGT